MALYKHAPTPQLIPADICFMSSRNQIGWEFKIYTGFVSNDTAWMSISFQIVPRRFIMVTTIPRGCKKNFYIEVVSLCCIGINFLL